MLHDGTVLLEFFVIGRTSFPRGFALPVTEGVAQYFDEGKTYKQLFTDELD